MTDNMKPFPLPETPETSFDDKARAINAALEAFDAHYHPGEKTEKTETYEEMTKNEDAFQGSSSPGEQQNPPPAPKRPGYVYTGIAACALLLVAGATYMYTPGAWSPYDDLNVYLGGESHYKPTPVPACLGWGAHASPLVPGAVCWEETPVPCSAIPDEDKAKHGCIINTPIPCRLDHPKDLAKWGCATPTPTPKATP
ncbi:MAG: hypothetical protein LBR29_00950 [Methylobacteriaceae bacterium]|jgi:hypothetical protein|nr:hypothetical protein [Methylobacteriaceae bacterium]